MPRRSKAAQYSTEVVESVNKPKEPVHLFIAGLGNVTMPMTRHSIGQYIVTSMAQSLDMTLHPMRGGRIATKLVSLPNIEAPVKVTLFKSKQLMNVSGPSIVSAYRFIRNKHQGSCASPMGQNFVVLADSITHLPMKLSPRFGGSPQGHNGLRSINGCLGKKSKEYWHFRVGVGRGEDDEGGRLINKSVDAAEWVLSPFSDAEKEYWGVGGEGLDAVLAELGRVAKQLEDGPMTPPEASTEEKEAVPSIS